MGVIAAKALEKHFGKVQALGPISFEIPSGAQVALLGESGSGKSTLLNLIGCMEIPSSGELQIAGQAVSGLDDRQLARMRLSKIGYVHQFFDLISDLTALENVQLPVWMAGESGSESRATDALKRLGLGKRLHFPVSVLSGGEQQRVAIARALILQPQVILADEPSGSLDSQTGSQVIDLLIEQSHFLGSTLVVATHSTGAAERFKNRIRLRDGQLIECVLSKGNL